MIETFHVQNFKALRDVTLHLTPIHLLIGPNDSGKTSILEAMAALSRSVDQELASSFPGRWTGTQLVTDCESDTPVSLKCDIDSPERLTYRLDVKFSPTQHAAFLHDEQVQLASGRPHDFKKPESARTASIVQRLAKKDRTAERDLNNSSFGLAGEDKPWPAYRKVHPALTGVDLFRWNARLLATPTALDTKSSFRMQASGFGLARVLDAILGFDRELFIKLEERFKVFFPDVVALRLTSTEAYSTSSSNDELVPKLSDSPGKGILIRFRDNPFDVPASQVSEGMLLVLAYLAVIFSPAPPRLLLVEEPENGLHPSRLADVVKMLREMVTEQSYTQVVLTSHSPYIVSLFKPDEVTLCRKNSDGYVEVKRLSESQIVKEQSEVFSLGEIWPAEEEAIFAEAAETTPVTESRP